VAKTTEDRGLSVNARTRNGPSRSGLNRSGLNRNGTTVRHAKDRSATASSADATVGVRSNRSSRAVADQRRSLRNSNGLRDPTSRSNSHKARWASCNRPPAAGVVVADVEERVAAELPWKVHHLSSKTRNAGCLGPKVLRTRTARVRKPRAPKVHRVRIVDLAAIAAHALIVPAVPAARDPIDRPVPNGPKAVRSVRQVPSVLHPPSVQSPVKAPELQPMPRRASVAASVAVVAAVVVVAARAARHKANDAVRRSERTRSVSQMARSARVRGGGTPPGQPARRQRSASGALTHRA
jgi:hypothetical protein